MDPKEQLESLRRTLAEEERNLLLIEEQKAKYVLETEIPVTLIKEERRKRDRIEELRRSIEELVQSQAGEPLIEGEDLREKELAYLDGLLKRYEYWRDHYTPLAGISEVRAAVEDGPRLDLPMPFIPPEFEKLVDGLGPQAEVRREPVDDLRRAIAEHRRIILLGDPGSGKTTTLWRLTYDCATVAREDAGAPLPVLVPLGRYTDDGPFDAYLAHHLGSLAPYLETYRASGRLVLLLDGLNEMPQADYTERVGHIQDMLDRYPDETTVVTCRALDYVVKLQHLQRVDILPLNGIQIHAFLCNYLGEIAGERLFWEMAGEEVRELWDTWQQASGTWDAFWTAERMSENIREALWWLQHNEWNRLQKEPSPLMALSRNPYLLLMTAQVYAAAGGKLPSNRAQLLARFVDTLLDREKKRHPQQWIETAHQKDGLTALAYAMQAEQGRGAVMAREWAMLKLSQAIPGCDSGLLLYLATSATLLDADDRMLRFSHQLLQEYFAAREMGRRVAAGESFRQYWSPDHWWEPSGWEETTILLSGMKPDASALLEELLPVNPVVAARCLVEGDAKVREKVRQGIVALLMARMTDDRQPAVARAQAGNALAVLGDPRSGMEVDPGTGLPDIVWCEVPAGSFLMGSKEGDELAINWEKPQHRNESIKDGYLISRYPVTNAQFRVFTEAGGYRERKYWTEAGWKQKEHAGWTGPYDLDEPFNLPNHPVGGVSWYEAVAFCCWLTEQLHQRGELEIDKKIALPTELQWEKAARGTDGRAYPWGDDPDPDRANYGDTGIGATSAVGCFPRGASPYGIEDLSGNIWEWCQTKFQDSYDDYRDDNDREGEAIRALRGGSFSNEARLVRCAFRLRNVPDARDRFNGFRVIVVSRAYL